MKNSCFALGLCLLFTAPPVLAQDFDSVDDELEQSDATDVSAWLSAGIEKDLPKGFAVGGEVEYRLSDHIGRTDRWSVGISASSRLYRNRPKTFEVKAELGVKYLRYYYPGVRKDKGNDHGFIEFNSRPSYSVPKIRGVASISASYKIAGLKITLRERYQITANDSVCVNESKWRYDKSVGDLVEKSIEEHWKATGLRHQSLRSRIQVSYKIPHFFIDPYASVEFSNDVDDALRFEKTRYTFGLDFDINKQNGVKLYYIWQNHADDDELSGHIIGLAYSFDF